MTKNEALEKLASFEKTNFSLGHAMGLIYYDASTAAPKDSLKARSITLSELSKMSYELTTSKDTCEMIETLMSYKDELDDVTKRKVTELYREYDRTRRIPVDEYIAWTNIQNEADAVWHEAKEKNDYAMFEPYLQKMFDTVKRIAKYIDPDKDPYETMLDMYERGLTVKMCDEFFALLRQKLVPLIRKVVANADKVNDDKLKQKFDVSKQREFSDFIMDVMCIDKKRCIIGETEHPFTTNFSKYDVRITTHYKEDWLTSSLYSVVHESGHALYELHTGDELQFSNLGGGVSMAIHESQSRFYENIIGRSREFCSILFGFLKEKYPSELDGVTGEEFYRMVNKSGPSLIRTEADELTYCLHIMIRYELEKRMFAGTLNAHDMPEAWNALYKEYLGLDVPDDKRGVLQDSHWSNGNIGYFPSYAIGSAYGAQYLNEMNKEFDVYGSVKSGSLSKINAWFEEKIWKYGCMKDPVELFESVCGKFDPEYFVDYLTKKFKDVYDLA